MFVPLNSGFWPECELQAPFPRVGTSAKSEVADRPFAWRIFVWVSDDGPPWTAPLAPGPSLESLQGRNPRETLPPEAGDAVARGDHRARRSRHDRGRQSEAGRFFSPPLALGQRQVCYGKQCRHHTRQSARINPLRDRLLRYSSIVSAPANVSTFAGMAGLAGSAMLSLARSLRR
jgi:hypothetical protein